MKLISKNTRLITRYAFCLLLGGSMVTSAISNAQTPQPFGFENNSAGSWVGYSSSESVAVNGNATYTRTGNYSLELITTSTSSNKQWYTLLPYDTAYNGTTVFLIYWAKTNVAGTTADASLRHETSLPLTSSTSSDNASGGVALSTSGWVRVTNAVNYSSSSPRYFFPAPRKTSSGSTQNIYVDDGVFYSSAVATTVDTVKPNAPSNVSATVSGNLVSLKWTSNVDNTGGIGVRSTIILRNSNTSAAAPVLNDQAQYSAAGGSSGPNTVSGGWQIVTTSSGPADTTYLDAAPAIGNYIYAVVLMDTAYNYSVAAVSGTITTTAPVPSIFVSQTGFNGNFGPVSMGSTSASRQYSVSAYNLTGNLTVTAPTGFQVSTASNTGFSSTINVTPVSGIVASTPVYVRFAPTAPTGATGNVNITNASTGASTVNVAVSGSAIDTLPTTVGSLTFGTVTNSSVVVNLPTVGNGTDRIIVASQSSLVSYSPVNGTTVMGVSSDFSIATDQGGGNKVVYDGAGSGNNVVTVTGLIPNTLYSFSVYEYNKGGNGSQAYLPVSPITALVKTDSINVGVVNITSNNEVKVYPNPARNIVYIASATDVNVSLCDVTGRIVAIAQKANEINVAQLPKGLYILTVISENGELLKREKIVLQ